MNLQNPSSSTPIDDLPYETAYAELETIVAALEANEHTLENALALFERGQALAQRCAALLDQAELKIQQLAGHELTEFKAQG